LCGPRRTANNDGVAGSGEELAYLVKRLPVAWPEVGFITRGDSRFCREDLMACCEMNQVAYVRVLAKKGRLTAEISVDLAQDAEQYIGSKQAARTYKEISHKTRESWLRVRKRTSLPSARGGRLPRSAGRR